MRAFALVILLASSIACYAQKLDRKVYDFGNVEFWNNPVATFVVTNMSKENMVFLPVFNEADVQIILPTTPIATNDTGHINVLYYTTEKGDFSKKLTLYVSNSEKPLELALKGNIKSFANGAVMSCPTLKPKKEVEQNQTVLIDYLPPIQQPEYLPVPTKPTTDNEVLPSSLYVPNNVVFLIDVSKSMQGPKKLPLLKQSMKTLVNNLRSTDQVTLITYSIEARTILPTTSAANKQYILAMIDTLETFGWTHGVKGIEHAYASAQQHFIQGGNNQIILSTDGVFNSPNFDEAQLQKFVKEQSKSGVILSVVGFGDDPAGKRLMRRLADNGKGNFIPFEEQTDVTQALVEEIREQSLMAKE